MFGKGRKTLEDFEIAHVPGYARVIAIACGDDRLGTVGEAGASDVLQLAVVCWRCCSVFALGGELKCFNLSCEQFLHRNFFATLALSLWIVCRSQLSMKVDVLQQSEVPIDRCSSLAKRTHQR